MKSILTSLAVLSAIVVAGCQSYNPELGVRDQYVVSTPEVRANRILYANPGDGKKDRRFVPLAHPDELDLSDASVSKRIAKNNEPLSVILNSVWLALPQEKLDETFDIAVVLTAEFSQQSGMQQIAAWYQTDTPLDDRLNFGDLLIYQHETWDSAKPIAIRVRIIDVTSERNIRTRVALNKVREFGGNVLLAASNPYTSTIFSVATEAASLLLTNQSNRVLLDYSANFYSAESSQQSGLDLTPLLLGRVVVVGTKEAEGKLTLDQRIGALVDEKKSRIRSPAVVMSLSNSELQLSPFTLAKSTYITNLINTATLASTTQYEQSLKTFLAATQAVAASERLRRSRSVSDLPALAESVLKAGVPDEVVATAVRRLALISGCRFLDIGGVEELTANIKNTSGATFDPESGRLIDPHFGKLCPSGQG